MASSASNNSTSMSANTWKSTTDPKDFVGCKIEIISNSDIRYVGTLYTFDPHASTISLKDVQSHGTENRRSGDQTVAPSHELYEYIVFRVSDIKDLVVCEPPSPNARRLSLMDPAIVNASDESGTSRPSGFPRVRYDPKFIQTGWKSGAAWGDDQRGANGNLDGAGSSNRSGRGGNANSGRGNSGAGRGGRGRGAGGRRGGTMGRGGGGRGFNGNGNNRRGAPVFPYPNQAGPQDWLTRYQKDMNLKAEFQNVNPDLSVLANIASSNDLPAEKVRDMMEGNWEAFVTASELPGKTEHAPADKKTEYKDGFFDSLTAPPPNPNEPMYNWRKDVQTFGPAVPNNGARNNNNTSNSNNQSGSGSSGQQRQSAGNNQQLSSVGGGGGWGQNATSSSGNNATNGQQSGGGWGQTRQRNGGGRNGQQLQNGGGWGQQNGGYSGPRRGRGRGGRMQNGGGNNWGQRNPMGNLANLLSQTNGGGSNGFGFTQRDLVIPGAPTINWTFNQRTQAALWTPAVGLDLTQQSTAPTTSWTFACASPAISESGYDALTPSPCA